ncbi:MAG TPA: tRNA (N6-threonylcarbamoyladenosine(37)-N6)-methyltransferase TrmO [Candidatus Thermoplasmatota archaeon]|nr:tRNA (N6-threonylcarbamoyladenosine(37)-N6)-methyltransferase TrmO [Candidatus Thermoplasmatota archaeon]
MTPKSNGPAKATAASRKAADPPQRKAAAPKGPARSRATNRPAAQRSVPIRIGVEPVGTVHNSVPGITSTDRAWGDVVSRIELSDAFSPDALDGIEKFSHVEVVFLFHKVAPEDIQTGTRHPRGDPKYPKVGVFAQRNKARPNRIGLTICTIEKREGRVLTVRGLDALDGSPVLDIKPVMEEFLPEGRVRQPGWSHEVLEEYW